MTFKLDIEKHKTDTIVKKLTTQLIPDVIDVNLPYEDPYSTFKSLYDANISIDGFIGCVVVNPSVLRNDVPINFENSSIFDEDGELIRQKTWLEYTTTYLKDGTAIILIGYRDENGNRSEEVSYKELRDYVNHFGIDLIKHRDDFIDLISSNEDVI